MSAPEATRCRVCDRPDCKRAEAIDWRGPRSDAAVRVFAECRAHAVDWRARALAAEEYRAKVEPLIEAVRAEIDRQVAARGSLGCEDLRRIGALLAATAPTKEHA